MQKVDATAKKLKDISKIIKKNMLKEHYGLHWYDTQRKNQVQALLAAFNDLKDIGIWNEKIKMTNGFFKFLLLEWGLSIGSRDEDISNQISDKPSAQKTPQEINEDLNEIINAIDRYSKDKNALAAVLTENEFKMSIIKEYGSIEKFVGNLKIGIINRPNDTSFRKVYDLYDRVFTIEDEKESFEGFNEILALNSDSKYLKKFGLFEETWIHVTEPKTGNVLGAINFDIYTMPRTAGRFGITASVHIIYIFVKDEYRIANISNVLLGAMSNYTREFLKVGYDKEIVIFSEQNSPMMMSLAQYIEDTENAGLDQADRIMRFARMGIRFLDFEYKQLPLSDGAETCEFLVMSVVSLRKKMPNMVVFEHLKRFFELSVLKGKDPEIYKEFQEMKAYLFNTPEIPILEAGDLNTIKMQIKQLRSIVKFNGKTEHMRIKDLIKIYLEGPVIEELTREYLIHTIEMLYKIYLLENDRLMIIQHLRTSVEKGSYKDEHFDMPFLKYYIIRDGERVIGCIGLASLKGDDETYWIGWFGVDAEYRRRGLGSKLISFVIDKARKDGKRYLKVYSSNLPEEAHAIEMYIELGFKEFMRENISKDYYYVYYSLDLKSAVK